MKKTVCIFPGQGAQYVGMGKDFFESFSIAKETFQQADEMLSFKLSNLIFEGPSEELTLTKNSQVAIYVMSMAILRVIKEQFPNFSPSVCAGLSLGEYTALTAADKLSFADGVDLVRSRGLYMNEASVKHPGTMAVVLGMDLAKIREVIEGEFKGQVWVANLNCPGQVVISGTLEGIDQASALLKEEGAKKVIRLDVSGAFHSGLMQEAKIKLEEKLQAVLFSESSTQVVMNVKGDYVYGKDEIKQCLIDQVISPVLWEKGICKIAQDGDLQFIEVGCGKTLSGMNRKIDRNFSPTLSIEKLEDLDLLLAKGCV